MNPVDQLLNRFDFAKVRKAMRATGHRWVRQQGPATIYYLPTEDQLRAQARQLLEQLVTDPKYQAGGSLSIGGFFAYRAVPPNPQDDHELALSFDIETASVALPP